ncbi:HAD-IIIC family phosphatase [Paenibacillus agilis]|uniref:HAD-IIIC family phosphatase n=1 Tax=Paenibacillus agilis TaxID=3020863 RepID=A0A559J102_9BACL|nr:HAD-IIIC family phosphatase [Paenibacillus agilis]TVX93560.1 HAD-IIIC family phosphatase [Paenibacillus agilis]
MNEIIGYSDILLALKRITDAESATMLLISDLSLEPILSQTLKVTIYDALSVNMKMKHIGLDDFFQHNHTEILSEADYIVMHIDMKSLLSSVMGNEDFLDLKLCFWNSVMEKIRELTQAPVLVLIPEQSYRDIEKTQVEYLREKLRIFCSRQGGYAIDLTSALTQVGTKLFYDYRALYAYHLPYSFTGCLAIAQVIVKEVKKIQGKYKKCIVLDCDNVLWGGILDEVSINGISLDTTYPGNQYLHFQEYLLKLHACGVILTICSKNNEEDVLQVLRSHPFMLINESHLATFRINWFNKADNIIAIVNEINISMDSVVFIDDSSFEINLIREAVPEVIPIQFDMKRPYEMTNLLERLDLFKTDRLTNDDLTRNASYIAERKRKEEKENYIDYEQYIKSLQIRIETETLNTFNVSRMSQLTIRTNKCNLSIRKYQVSELLEMTEDENYWIRCFKLSDRFGDYGYIGFLIVHIKNCQHLHVDGFYLSCRAFGRNVEHYMVDFMKDSFQSEDVNITYSYVSNGKNEEFSWFMQEYLNSKSERGLHVVE